MAARLRAMAPLLAGAALMNAAMAAASAVSTIVAAGVLGVAWGGSPPVPLLAALAWAPSS